MFFKQNAPQIPKKNLKVRYARPLRSRPLRGVSQCSVNYSRPGSASVRFRWPSKRSLQKLVRPYTQLRGPNYLISMLLSKGESPYPLSVLLPASVLLVTTVIWKHNHVTLSPMGIDGPICGQSIYIAYSSNCPSSAWQHAIGSTMHPHPTLFDVGSNKGYTTNEFLLRFDAKWQISQQEWHEFLIHQ
jgi:hypothetical protein